MYESSCKYLHESNFCSTAAWIWVARVRFKAKRQAKENNGCTPRPLLAPGTFLGLVFDLTLPKNALEEKALYLALLAERTLLDLLFDVQLLWKKSSAQASPLQKFRSGGTFFMYKPPMCPLLSRGGL